jgi:hypothetical protein
VGVYPYLDYSDALQKKRNGVRRLGTNRLQELKIFPESAADFLPKDDKIVRKLEKSPTSD